MVNAHIEVKKYGKKIYGGFVQVKGRTYPIPKQESHELAYKQAVMIARQNGAQVKDFTWNKK